MIKKPKLKSKNNWLDSFEDGGNLGDPPVNPYAQGMNPLMTNTLVSSTTSAPIKQYNLPVKPIKQEEPKEYSNTYTKFNKRLDPIEKDFISIKDTRKIQPVTLKPINPNTDLKTGNYDYGNIQRVIGAAKFVGVPPDLALAITMTENGIGKNDDNFGHVLSGWLPNVDKKINELDEETINKYSYPALQLAYAMQEKIKNPNDLKSIQSYNGTKNLTPNTEKGMEGSGNKNGVKSWYGVDVTKQPLNAGKVLPFAKTVKSIQDSVINTNPQIQQLIKNGKLKNGGRLNKYITGGIVEPEDPVNPYAQGMNPLMPQTLSIDNTSAPINILPTKQELEKNQLDKVIEKNNSNRPVIKQNKKPDPTSFNEDDLKVIQLGLDAGQMIPLTSFPSYIASLPFTTNDVVNDLSKKEYKQAGLDALGYIPTFKAFKYGLKGDKVLDTSSKLAKQYRKINHVVNIANFSNDANQIKKQNGGWLNNYK